MVNRLDTDQMPHFAVSELGLNCSDSRVASAPDFGLQGPEFESYWRQNSGHYKEIFIITLPLSNCDLNNVERDINTK